MKTIAILITENLPELTLIELNQVMGAINGIMLTEKRKIQAMYDENEYIARKYLMNSGLTHSQAIQFIKEYIH